MIEFKCSMSQPIGYVIGTGVMYSMNLEQTVECGGGGGWNRWWKLWGMVGIISKTNSLEYKQNFAIGY